MAARELVPAPHARPAAALPFVGRGREVGRLWSLLCPALAEGRAALAVVSGASGLGTTRLLQVIAWLARRSGHDVLSGSASPLSDGRALPVGRILQGRLLGVETTGRAPEPLLVVLDDAHQADAGGLEVLRALGTGVLPGACVLLGTSERTGPSSPTAPLAALVAEADLLVTLGPLARRRAVGLARLAVTGGHPSPTAVARISGGSPMVISALTVSTEPGDPRWEGDPTAHRGPIGFRDGHPFPAAGRPRRDGSPPVVTSARREHRDRLLGELTAAVSQRAGSRGLDAPTWMRSVLVDPRHDPAARALAQAVHVNLLLDATDAVPDAQFAPSVPAERAAVHGVDPWWRAAGALRAHAASRRALRAGHLAVAVGHSREAVRRAPSRGPSLLVEQMRLQHVDGLLALDAVDEARVFLEWWEERDLQAGRTSSPWWCLGMGSWEDSCDRPVDATGWARRALDAARRARDETAAARALIVLSAYRALAGDTLTARLGELELGSLALAGHRVDERALRPWPTVVLAAAHAEPGVPDGCRELHLTGVLTALLVAQPGLAVVLTEIAVRTADAPRAEQVTQEIRRLADDNPHSVSLAIAARWSRGVLAGEQRALRTARDVNGRLSRAHLLHVAATHGGERGDGGDGDAVTVVTDRGEAFESLTPSQRRVAELVARGRTNREIADLLVLSPHTVDSHLRRIFCRLGVSTRVALTRLACHADDATSPVSMHEE